MPRFVALKKLLHKGQKQQQKELQGEETSVLLPTIRRAPPLLGVPQLPELEALRALPPPEEAPAPAEPSSPLVRHISSPQIQQQLNTEQVVPLQQSKLSNTVPVAAPELSDQEQPKPMSVQASPLSDFLALPQPMLPKAAPVIALEPSDQGQPQQEGSHVQPHLSDSQPPPKSPLGVTLRGPGEFTIIEENGAYRLTFNADLDRAAVQSLLGIPTTSVTNAEAAGTANNILQAPGRGDYRLPNSAQARSRVIHHTFRTSQQDNVDENTVKQNGNGPAEAAARTFSPDDESVVDDEEAHESQDPAPHVEDAKPNVSKKNYKKPAKRSLPTVEESIGKIKGAQNAGQGKERVIKPLRRRDRFESQDRDSALGLPGIMQNGLGLNPPNGHNQYGAPHRPGPAGHLLAGDMQNGLASNPPNSYVQHGTPHGLNPTGPPILDDVPAAMYQHPELHPPPVIDPRFLTRVKDPPEEWCAAARAAFPLLPIVGMPPERDVPDKSRLGPEELLLLSRHGVGTELEQSFKGVIEVRKHQITGKLFVVKKERFEDPPSKRAQATYGRELAMFESRLKVHNHPNIIKYHFYAQDETDAYMVLEYCTGGDLSKLISHFRDSLRSFTPRRFINHFIASMADALAYLHCGLPPSSNAPAWAAESVPGWEPIIHADIKPDNIFTRWSEAESDRLPDVVLGDFGNSGTQQSHTGTWGGTHGYLAPELDREEIFCTYPGMHVGKSMVTTAGDVYAFGATLYEVVTGEPYQSFLGSKEDIGTKYAQVIMEPLEQVDRDLTMLTRYCLHEIPRVRYDALELYAHGNSLKVSYENASARDMRDCLPAPSEWRPETYDRGRSRGHSGERGGSDVRRSSPDFYDSSPSCDANDGSNPSSIAQERRERTFVDLPIWDEADDRAAGQADPVYPVTARDNKQIKLTDFLLRKSIRLRPCNCIRDVSAFKHPWHRWHPRTCSPRNRREKRLSKARQIERATFAEWNEIYGPSTAMLKAQEKLEKRKKREEWEVQERKEKAKEKRKKRNQKRREGRERQAEQEALEEQEKQKKQKQKRQKKQKRQEPANPSDCKGEKMT